MKSKNFTKIILISTMSIFVIFSFGISLKTNAATDLSNLYSNPNQSSNSSYKFKISDVVNSNILTQVVGCTGVVNKAATWMSTIIQSPEQAAQMAQSETKKYKDLAKQACLITKAAAKITGDSIPTIGGIGSGLSTAIDAASIVGSTTSDLSTIPSITTTGVGGSTVNTKALATSSSNYSNLNSDEKKCIDNVNAMSDDVVNQLIKQNKLAQEKNYTEQCFDGIAVTLARNQLTSMTRSAMNWVNSGFGGNPFFVQNMQNFTTKLENNVIETGIDSLLAPGGDLGNQNPYARDFATSTIAIRDSISSSAGFLGNLQSTLENFVTDPNSYYTQDQLQGAQDTRTAVMRAQNANNAFSNDFMSGGWEGWLGLTQIDQNNPLGFSMITSQYLSDMANQQVQDTQNELLQNGGFLSQKTCIKYKTIVKYNETTGKMEESYEDPDPNKRTCIEYKTITPGSIIRDKTTNYLNSPERQLELAKTINDSLNALFSVLISKLEGNGLSGLSDSVSNTSNWNDNLNNFISSDGNSTYDNGGAYNDFNLTKDLGNTYIHDPTISLGTWNAKTNSTSTGLRLYPTYSADDSSITPQTYGYYTVTVSGDTKLIISGYNGWEVGDRAFWDGEKWQNWKKGQASPIKKRGVVQIQQDYIVAAQELLGVLPKVMNNLGELDYCIPGPNPNYKINSADAQTAYQSWISSMQVVPMDQHRTKWTMDHETDSTFKNFESIFSDNTNVWKSVLNSSSMWLLHHFGRDGGTIPSHDCVNNTIPGKLDGLDDCGNYFYDPTDDNNGNNQIADRKDLMNTNLDYTNNNLFQNFYSVFDSMMNKFYFNNITSKYLDTETNISVNENPAYVEMAVSGYDLTKNIIDYNNNTSDASQEYTNAINQAKINIAKLNPIKDEVSGIIKAAQDRRNNELLNKINEERIKNGETKWEMGDFKKTYQSCLDEENVQFFDADSITNTGKTSQENCKDGIDNDLNGLTDAQDPACGGVISNNDGNTRNTTLNGSGYRR